MIKKALARGLVSYAVCVTVQVLVALGICVLGNGMVTIPEFTRRVGDPVTAAMIQLLLIGLIGFAFGAGSIFFEIESWSFLKQGAAHLGLTAVAWIVAEWVCFSPLTLPAVLSMGLSAAVSYGITWGCQYFVWRNKVRRLDEQIRKKNGEDKL